MKSLDKNKLFEEIRLLDFRALQDEQFWEIYGWIQRSIDTIPEGLLLSLRLGGRVDPDYFSEPSELLTFIKVNALDQKFLILRKQLSYDRDEGPLLPIVLGKNNVVEVAWNELIPIRYEGGIRFFYQSVIAFQTDANLRLVAPFSVMGDGIVQYDPWRAAAIFPVEKIPLYEGKAMLEVWQGERLFLVLTSLKGCVYAIGMEGGHIITPPNEYFIRGDEYQISKFEICDLRLKTVLKELEREKYSWKKKKNENYLLGICELLKTR